MENKTCAPKPIRKNKNTEIKFEFNVFGGRLYLDVREYMVGNYTDPIKKGICFDVNLIPELIKNLEDAQEYLNKTKDKQTLTKVIEILNKGERVNLQYGEKLIKYCYKNGYFKESVALFK